MLSKKSSDLHEFVSQYERLKHQNRPLKKMQKTPLFTAEKQETEMWRINRLHMVWGYVMALAEQHGKYNLISNVAELRDHKGELIIKWNAEHEASADDFF